MKSLYIGFCNWSYVDISTMDQYNEVICMLNLDKSYFISFNFISTWLNIWRKQLQSIQDFIRSQYEIESHTLRNTLSPYICKIEAGEYGGCHGDDAVVNSSCHPRGPPALALPRHHETADVRYAQLTVCEILNGIHPFYGSLASEESRIAVHKTLELLVLWLKVPWT